MAKAKIVIAPVEVAPVEEAAPVSESPKVEKVAAPALFVKFLGLSTEELEAVAGDPDVASELQWRAATGNL